MSIPRNLCLFLLDTVRLPKISDIVSITFVFTSSSTCDTLFLSTYHDVVHCLSWMVIFFMNLSYGLIRNPCYFSVFEYRSYHSSADPMHPYKAFRRLRYSTFTPFPTRFSSFVWGSPSTWCPQTLSRYLIGWIYTLLCQRWGMHHGHQKKYLPSCASMMRLVNKASR